MNNIYHNQYPGNEEPSGVAKPGYYPTGGVQTNTVKGVKKEVSFEMVIVCEAIRPGKEHDFND